MSASRIRRDQRRARTARVRDALRPNLPPVLREAWDNACYVWSTFCFLFETPAGLADRETLAMADYKQRRDWIRHLERLARMIVLAAAFALNLILRPAQPRTHAPRPRKRRLRLAWPDRPATWRTHFAMLTDRRNDDGDYDRIHNPPRDIRVVDSFPLARRLEAVRRVLANPDAHIRRFAIKLARIAQANTRANAPREFRLRAWSQHPRRPTPGHRMIAPSMADLYPLADDLIAQWNEAADPG